MISHTVCYKKKKGKKKKRKKRKKVKKKEGMQIIKMTGSFCLTNGL
jgi:hypothetical protein